MKTRRCAGTSEYERTSSLKRWPSAFAGAAAAGRSGVTRTTVLSPTGLSTDVFPGAAGFAAGALAAGAGFVDGIGGLTATAARGGSAGITCVGGDGGGGSIGWMSATFACATGAGAGVTTDTG